LDIEEFDTDIVNELRSRARDVLLTRAIASEEQIENASPAETLQDLPGMTAELVAKLNSQGVLTVDDLADQSVDELVEVAGIDEKQAAAFIMKARESWF